MEETKHERAGPQSASTLGVNDFPSEPKIGAYDMTIITHNNSYNNDNNTNRMTSLFFESFEQLLPNTRPRSSRSPSTVSRTRTPSSVNDNNKG